MAPTYRKLQVFTKTFNFAEAVKVVEVPLVEPPADRIRVKQIYAGINARDVAVTAAIFPPQDKLPFDIGFEVGQAFVFVSFKTLNKIHIL